MEKRVIYAQFQFSIFGENSKMAEDLALDLLTRIDLEKEPSLFLIGNETLLQQDVMGPAAEKILEGWGKSDWIERRN